MNAIRNLKGYVTTQRSAGSELEKAYKKWKFNQDLPNCGSIIDVGIGANGTPELWCHYPEKHYLFVDPLRECEESVWTYFENDSDEQHLVFVCTAVGAARGYAKILIKEKLSTSSILSELDASYDVSETRTVPVQSLDGIVGQHGQYLVPPYGLKVDTEGYEAEVIKGARNTLGNCAWVIVEVAYRKQYSEQYNLSGFIQLMELSGFVLSDILKAGNNGKADMVFTKRTQPNAE